MAAATITPDHDTILAEVFIAAPPARVFEAITDPKQRAQWWGIKPPGSAEFPDAVPFRVITATSDLRVGGKWTNEGIRGEDQHFHLEGKYLEIDPPRLLVHTRMADFVGGFETVVRWELEPCEVRGLHGSGTHQGRNRHPVTGAPFRVRRPPGTSQQPPGRLASLNELAESLCRDRRNLQNEKLNGDSTHHPGP